MNRTLRFIISSFIFLVFIIIIAINVYAADTSQKYAGLWKSEFGSVNVTDCRDDACGALIKTENSGHECEIFGVLFTNSSNSAKLYFGEGEEAKEYITFILKDSNTLEVDIEERYIPQAQFYCGSKGFFTGTYFKGGPKRKAQQSAGFDCSKARNRVERAICQNPELGNLDKEMNKIYREVNSRIAQSYQEEQRGWIYIRNECEDVRDIERCVAQKYRERISQLERDADRFLGE